MAANFFIPIIKFALCISMASRDVGKNIIPARLLRFVDYVRCNNWWAAQDAVSDSQNMIGSVIMTFGDTLIGGCTYFNS